MLEVAAIRAHHPSAATDSDQRADRSRCGRDDEKRSSITLPSAAERPRSEARRQAGSAASHC